MKLDLSTCSAAEDHALEESATDSWARFVLLHPIELLNDHAYLERKAVGNALELLNRWPEPDCPHIWVPTLTAIAQDEANHLDQVVHCLQKRGGRLQRTHRNPYANQLRSYVRKGDGVRELVDRLIVAALIELRSCDRFHALARNSEDPQLSKLYHRLWACEKGHYQKFLELARFAVSSVELHQRWTEMQKIEGRIIKQQPQGPSLHSGEPEVAVVPE